MDPRKHLIIANEKVITESVRYLKYNKKTKQTDVIFVNGKTYSYAYDHVNYMKASEVINPDEYRVTCKGIVILNIDKIYKFRGKFKSYYYVDFKTGKGIVYSSRDLKLEKTKANRMSPEAVFNYIKEAAQYTGTFEENGENLLLPKFDKVDARNESSALAVYLNPEKYFTRHSEETIPVFPFGCNKSQFRAVKNALENNLSVIEGPPGTGKTQTILNIIANIIIKGKTVEVVSNNNAATDNIFEKLSDSKYAMDFIAAPLGKTDNKLKFVANQKESYPDISEWENKAENPLELLHRIENQSKELESIFEKQEKLALCRHELKALLIEKEHHKEVEVSVYSGNSEKAGRNITGDDILAIWHRLESLADNEKKLPFLMKVKLAFVDRLFNWKFYKNDISTIIFEFQNFYYKKRAEELESSIESIEKELSKEDADAIIKKYTEDSLTYFKSFLFAKYGNKDKRKVFKSEDLYWNYREVLGEYPLVLSTTFSSTSSLSSRAVFDYVIMDEASQVDIAGGVLALSCAGNAVIVGDRKQLPNIINGKQLEALEALAEKYDVPAGYNFAENSFLQSVCRVAGNVPVTLLREHYRCHPKIIDFCNRKFYGGQLVIMTKDDDEKDVLSAIKTVRGNHERNHMNQREIDVITKEILPEIDEGEDVGIISPYRNQINAIQKAVEGRAVDVDTVHKFQGREKDVIILSTVDNELNDFSDDPYLLNVAISRAKKRLYVVSSGNEQRKDSNLNDLIQYMEYNNFSVTESKLHSVFDYLYKQYWDSRQKYLKTHKRISEFDSENLMYNLILDTLISGGYTDLDVICHQPLNALIKDLSLLDDDEAAYALHPATHLDFLIYNRVTKIPVLAIEVDGWKYHKDGTKQAERDKKKNSILKKYALPLIRFATTESNEKERLIEKLEEIYREK